MEDCLTNKERDDRVLELLDQVLEIERRLIPTGLHVFGRAAGDREIGDMLAMVASFERPELGLSAMTDLIAQGLGFQPYSVLLEEGATSEPRLAEREQVEAVLREAIAQFLAAKDASGIALACSFLAERARVSTEQSQRVFALLDRIAGQLKTDRELDGLMRALRGRYVEPGPGADIIQNPNVLPTGRNTHAINPYSVPSPAAVRRAEHVSKALLERHESEAGRHPETIAMVLWGIDNIKTEGEAVAQALWLLGVTPRRDSLNRATDVDVIPLERLGRPRIDVVMTVSGIFRDLFGATMGLLDLAVRRVAALDEPGELNYVRKHVADQMAEAGCTFDEAVVRVFSNAAGNYGTNVNFMVLESQWEDSAELGDLFVTRKCFAYGRDSEGRGFDGREARKLLERALSRVEVTYQNIDNTEVGITDVDHYFEYLGGVSKAVEKQTGARPKIYMSDTLAPVAKVRTLEETIRLETRTKTLNPKWFEGMLRHGFSGVSEIEHHVTNTFGWSATADAVDDWVYSEVATTYVLDEKMLERLRSLNPHSARTLVGRLLEASGRGYWSADEGVLKRLRDVFAGLEDELEGVAG
ncbi:MAG TPA: cobaltochelatase subunit CobN [Blastocatellia bacterium]|jgi:magnesium chelatase subunit H|nr:cobaltochelatase subunit CobN [Blastocatellia bacterium]